MKKNLSLIIYFIFGAILIFSYADTLHAEAVSAGEIEKYIKMLKSDSVKIRTDAAKRISRSRLTNSKLLTIINKKLIKEYNLHPTSKYSADEMAWYCKALASSGNTIYKKTLATVAEKAINANLKRHAAKNLGMISQIAKSKKIAAESQKVNNNLSPEINKYIGMLKSGDFTLQKNAARKIIRARLTEEKLFDVVGEELLKGYKKLPRDRNHIDAMAWLCKALGSSGMAKYKPTFQEVSENSPNRKLKGYAKKYLNQLF